MKSPLVINIRCTCIEEYINIQKLHKEYMRQSKAGEITSVYVGAEFAVPGEFETVDVLIAKRGQRVAPCVVAIGNRPIIREEPIGAQAVDVAEPEAEEKSSISEFAIGDRAEEFHYEDKEKPENPFSVLAEEPVKAKPETTLTDVLTAMAEEPDPMGAIKTEAEGEPDGDGQDYNATYAG